MFCKNCGKQLKDDDAFCPSCGQSVGYVASADNVQVNSSKTVKLIIHRKKSFFGAAVSTKIHIDGQMVASVKSNGKAEFDLVPGTHELTLDMWSGVGKYNIDLPADCSAVYVEIGLKMGFWTNKVVILSTRNEK